MKLLPNEEKIATLTAVNLHLTNKRLIHDKKSYGSVNLKDVTLIKTESHSKTIALIMAIILIGGSLLISGEAKFIGIVLGAICAAFYVRTLYSTLDIHVPGSSGISITINGVNKSVIKEFIYKIENEINKAKV